MQLSISFKSNVLRILTVLGAAVILLLFIFWGWSSGKYLAQSENVIANATNITGALDYFYQDQDRYPSALEFQDRNIMMNYLNISPPFNFTSKNCEQSYLYKRIKPSEYLLGYCLPKGIGGQSSGWNQVKN